MGSPRLRDAWSAAAPTPLPLLTLEMTVLVPSTPDARRVNGD